MIKLVWHVWRRGHSVSVNRGITTGLFDSSRGWLYTCECGHQVAK